MAVAPELRALARSAYRALWRVSSSTFRVTHCIAAFRQKMRSDALANSSNALALEEHIKVSREVSDVLRRNVVQGFRINDTEDTYHLRITPDTELGDNSMLKNNTHSCGSGRTTEHTYVILSVVYYPDADAVQHDAKRRRSMNFPEIKRAYKTRIIPELNESDLEESFVRGSGPGGQSINKTENNVQLLHKPSGIRIHCQDTRSLEQNRKLARRRLLEKLDNMLNPGISKQHMQIARRSERERQRRKKAKK
ncbi:hypothetical protein FISHEDRAFT_14108, partial [Fistulina hepatica ATCC 64428]